MTKAHEILTKAARSCMCCAATYDKHDGERSIGATIAAFKAITGDGLMNTEERGWLFMSLLKKVRSQQGVQLIKTHSRTPANWTEEDETRQSVIMQNGNDGLHYDIEPPEWVKQGLFSRLFTKVGKGKHKPTSPIVRASEYLIQWYNKQNKCIAEEVHKRSYQEALQIAKAKVGIGDVVSWRIMRCLDNSKYNKWSAE